jgi:hypothetical protein
MIASLLVLLPLVALAVWAFLRFTPPHADRPTVRRYNLISLGGSFMLAAAWTVRTYVVMTPTEDAAWWPIISLLGALVIVPFALAVAAVARNLIVFRRNTEAPSR